MNNLQIQSWIDSLDGIKPRPQTQEALNDQFKKLQILANRFGLYDAADYIRYNILKEK